MDSECLTNTCITEMCLYCENNVALVGTGVYCNGFSCASDGDCASNTCANGTCLTCNNDDT